METALAVRLKKLSKQIGFVLTRKTAPSTVIESFSFMSSIVHVIILVVVVALLNRDSPQPKSVR